MGIERLILQKQVRSLGPIEPVQFRTSAGIIAAADELAEELSVSRAEVLREMLDEGYRVVMSQWERALEDGAKTAAKSKGKK